jgi:hypothetical protein
MPIVDVYDVMFNDKITSMFHTFNKWQCWAYFFLISTYSLKQTLSARSYSFHNSVFRIHFLTPDSQSLKLNTVKDKITMTFASTEY